jgi:hypothetical protein
MILLFVLTSTDGGSNYNVAATTTYFLARHYENDTDTALTYDTGNDLAQGTGFQFLFSGNGNGADENGVGILQLFNPASTTYVKHFISTNQYLHAVNISINTYVAGYFNTTSAVNAVQFKMASGNMDGTILMFGIK